MCRFNANGRTPGGYVGCEVWGGDSWSDGSTNMCCPFALNKKAKYNEKNDPKYNPTRLSSKDLVVLRDKYPMIVFANRTRRRKVAKILRAAGFEQEARSWEAKAQLGVDVVESLKPKTKWIAATGEALLKLLRKAAERAKSKAGKRARVGVVIDYERNGVIRKAVLNRANGICEYCELPARYFKKSGEPLLEPHHIDLVSQGGADDPWFVAAVHADCHDAAHRGATAIEIREKLVAKLTILKQELMSA